MSGLDGLGWPNPDDVERERDEIRAQLRAQLREEQQLHVQTLNERGCAVSDSCQNAQIHPRRA